MKQQLKNFFIVMLSITFVVLASCSGASPTPAPSTRVIKLPTAANTSAGTALAGIGDVIEVDGWQFVVDDLGFVAQRPDGNAAAEGHEFAQVGITVKNNSDQCRRWQISGPDIRTVDVPRKYAGGILFSPSQLQGTTYPLMVPWILDSRGYGHAGSLGSVYSYSDFKAPPGDVWQGDYWFNVPTANANHLELHLDTISGLSAPSVLFDLSKHSQNPTKLKPDLASSLVPIGKAASFKDKWALTVQGAEFSQIQSVPFGQPPPMWTTPIKAQIENLQGTDAVFPYAENNPNADFSNFYAVDTNNRIAATTVDALTKMSGFIAPAVKRDVQIPLYSLFQMDTAHLRFTAILNIQTCEYAHFDVSSK